jgi:hypothetical protein
LLILVLALSACVALPASGPAQAPAPNPEATFARPQFYEFYSPL